jgi:hypothetical protein
VLDSRVPSVVAVEEARQIRSRRRKRDGGAFGPQVRGPTCQEKPLNVERWVLVPQTDTGRRVEDTQANGRTFVKEFGKLAP